MKKLMLVAVGSLFLALGAIGAVVPMLPSFPFLFISAWAFAGSSKRLDARFKKTKLYQNMLQDYAQERCMTVKNKARVMLMVTALMSIGFVVMGRKGIVLGCAVLFVVWIFHIVYFALVVKTKTRD